MLPAQRVNQEPVGLTNRKTLKYDECESEDEDEMREDLLMGRLSSVIKQKTDEVRTDKDMLQSNPAFKNYKELFSDLLSSTEILTEEPIV